MYNLLDNSSILAFFVVGYRRIWHSGGLFSYITLVWIFPDINAGIYFRIMNLITHTYVQNFFFKERLVYLIRPLLAVMVTGFRVFWCFPAVAGLVDSYSSMHDISASNVA